MSKIIKTDIICPAWCKFRGHRNHFREIRDNPAGGSLCCDLTGINLYIDDYEDWFIRSFSDKECVFKQQTKKNK
jgi:hypothetical protein